MAVSNEKKGDVVATGCGAAYYVQLYVVVSGKGRETFIKSLLDHILLEHDKASASDDTVLSSTDTHAGTRNAGTTT